MSKKIISSRLSKVDSSVIRAAFSLANNIKDPIDLSIGFPEDDTPRKIRQAGISAIKDGFTRYTPSNGIIELRQAIAKKLASQNDIHLSPKQVTIVPGLTTGILLIYLSILDLGDELILSDPFFPPYRDIALMLGAKVVYADTFPDFQLTAERLQPLITKKTKAIVINSPNNPSGAVYPKNELKKIAELAKKHNLIIISDEIYEYFSYDHHHFSIGSIYHNTLTLNGFSKAFAMTGWRLGYVAGPFVLIEAINELQQYIVFSSSSIAQRAALAALRYNPKNLTSKYRHKRDLTVKLLEEKFNVQGAQGAFYAFVSLPDGIDDLLFVKRAAKEKVIILPGQVFSKHKNYIRIAYGNTKEQIESGIKIVNSLLD